MLNFKQNYKPEYTPTTPTRKGIPFATNDTANPELATTAPTSIHFCSPNILINDPEMTPVNMLSVKTFIVINREFLLFTLNNPK